ncbi:MAG TPA: DUF72 domain-containing protein [Candidatus Parcubacteria bacterium]|nr:DUF72 domain-containing protein [Candidatus Parcubacteria bacterium]
MTKGKIFIGTSGWDYRHWDGFFYPPEINQKEKLEYFSRHFNAVEVNYSFYHPPKESTYKKWYSQTNGNFLFSLKVSRFITHIKRLKGIENVWQEFLEKALKGLKEKLGPILVQLPPTFRYTEENLERVEKFLSFTKNLKKKKNQRILLAVEVRNSSFDKASFFNLLKKHKTALVLSSSSQWAEIKKPFLCNFVYVRLHGPASLFSSKYSFDELKRLAKEINLWRRNGLDVYCYFNNDAYGYAVENANYLKSIISNNAVVS